MKTSTSSVESFEDGFKNFANTPAMDSRSSGGFRVYSPSSDVRLQFMNDVEAGFSKPLKAIPSHWLYDARGSRLFTEITALEEYDLTRNEMSILQSHGRDIAKALSDRKWRIIELGAGDGVKTEVLLRAFMNEAVEIEYWPIDVSPSALEDLCSRMSEKIPGLVCHPTVGDNLQGLKEIAAHRKLEGLLILDLGSSIGNRSRAAVEKNLREVRSQLSQGDAMLVGFDLIKETNRMIAAYDDKRGVTRAFNLNLLDRMNRELGAEFDISSFKHEATWNPEINGMESWLISLRDQDVYFRSMGRTFHFRKWEPIHTEISLKFSTHEIQRLANLTDFREVFSLTDKNQNFTDVLWKAKGHDFSRPLH